MKHKENIPLSDKRNLMDSKNISFKSTDELIRFIKNKYETEGLQGVVRWAENDLKEGSEITLARDVTNLSDIESSIVYDRAVIQLNGRGEETHNYYLYPLHTNAFEANLFLSIRLNFIEQPFELLIYTRE